MTLTVALVPTDCNRKSIAPRETLTAIDRNRPRSTRLQSTAIGRDRPGLNRPRPNLAPLALAILTLAVVPLVVLPSAVDSFELPKRLVWLLAAALPFLSARPLEKRSLPLACGASILLLWIVLRTGLAGFSAKTLPPMAVWLLPGLLFLSGFLSRPDERALRSVGCALFISGVFQAVAMLLQRFGLDPFFAATTAEIDYLPGRMIGTIGYQNHAAEFVGLCLFASCLWRPAAKPFRIFRFAGCVPMLAAIVLSANRGAMLACAAAGLWMVVQTLPKRRVAIALGVALVVGSFCAVVIPELRGRISELSEPLRSPAVVSRVLMDKAALSLWSDRPLFGSGAGGYAYEYIDRLGRVFPRENSGVYINSVVYAREAHCDILQFAAEFGLAGLLLLSAFGFALIQRLHRRENAAEGLRTAAPVLLFAGICSLFNFTFQTPVVGPLTGILLGLLAGRNPESPEVGAPVSKTVSAFVFSLPLAGFICCAVVLFRENRMNLRVASILGTGDPSATERFLLTDAPKGRWLAICGASLATTDGREEAAERAIADSLRDHVSPESLNNYANALVRQRKYGEACAVYERLKASGIMHREALHDLAVVLYARRDWPAAFASWREFRVKYPGEMTDDDWYRYISCILQTGTPLKALQKLRWIEERFASRGNSPWNASWENLYGAAFLASGDEVSAALHFAKALELDPRNAGAARNLNALQTRPGAAPVSRGSPR